MSIALTLTCYSSHTRQRQQRVEKHKHDTRQLTLGQWTLGHVLQEHCLGT